ncbi:hypothetical protein BURK2_01863 [Burkholderiales bacterium]|nr:hypothetical protein BURK2_01863 [Burkholderiales bacterium]
MAPILTPRLPVLLESRPVTMDYLPARPADAPAIAALHALSWRANYRGILPDGLLDGPIEEEHLAVWRERLASPRPERQFILLARGTDGLRGFVSVLLDQEPAWGARLENLHVHPENKGQGMGRALLVRAREWVEAVTPGNRLHLWVLAKNAPARAFYERLGGAPAEEGLWQVPSGEAVAELRYLWPALAPRTGMA